MRGSREVMFRDRSVTPGIVGASIVVVLVAATALASLIAPHGQSELVGEVWAPISMQAPLGLDNLGRDMLSRLLYGGQATLFIAISGTALAFTIGLTLGLVAAVTGGWADEAIARVVDAVMALPPLICALVLLSVLGTSIPILIATIAVLSSTRVFRLTRALAGSIVVLDYVEAARLRREGIFWLAAREILPNITMPLMAEFGLRLCSNFLLIASLSFLGLGIQPPLADWGSMVRENAAAIGFGGMAPLLPAAAIGLFAIGVNLVVDWGLALQTGQRD